MGVFKTYMVIPRAMEACHGALFRTITHIAFGYNDVHSLSTNFFVQFYHLNFSIYILSLILLNLIKKIPFQKYEYLNVNTYL